MDPPAVVAKVPTLLASTWRLSPSRSVSLAKRPLAASTVRTTSSVVVPLSSTAIGGSLAALTSSTIVPIPWPSAMVALTGELRTTENDSVLSTSESSMIGTLMVRLVSPGAKVKEPVNG